MLRPTFKDYSRFTTEDFISDPYFQDWILEPREEDNRFWQNFREAYPQQAIKLKEARKLVESIQYKPYKLDTEQKERLLHNIYQPKLKEGKVVQLYFFRSGWAKVAAVILVLIVASIFVWQLAPSYQTYQTAFEETTTFTLADGTVVALNANSTLKARLPEEENQPREVWLEGEAFFDVEHLNEEETSLYPEQQKFLVHTTGFTIEVLGTEFNVFSREQKSEVLLTSGIVKVENEVINQSEVLQPGDLLSLRKDENQFSLQRKEVISLPWREGFFVFEETPLTEVARQIQDFYGLDVTFASEDLTQKQFTAKIPQDQLDVLLHAIEESFNITIIRKEDIIRIQP